MTAARSAFLIRIPLETLRTVRRIAHERRVSMNTVIVETLASALTPVRKTCECPGCPQCLLEPRRVYCCAREKSATWPLCAACLTDGASE